MLNITWSSGSPLPSTGWVLVAGHIQDVLGTSPFSATNRAGGRAWGILQRCASTGMPQSPSPHSGVSHAPLPKGLPLFCFGTTEKNPGPACSPQSPEPLAPFNWPGSAPEYHLCPGSISAWGKEEQVFDFSACLGKVLIPLLPLRLHPQPHPSLISRFWDEAAMAWFPCSCM